jgi:phosphotransferase system enzyme I (PtsI)
MPRSCSKRAGLKWVSLAGRGVLEASSYIEKLDERMLEGIAASPGIAMGKAFVCGDVLANIREEAIEEGQISSEITKMKETASIVRGQLEKDRSRTLKEVDKKDAEIFSAHILILEDSHFLDKIASRIAQERINAQTALIRELDKYGALFSRIEDPYLRERIADIRDIGRRLLEVLAGHVGLDSSSDDPVIIAAQELTSYETIRFRRERVLAFVTERGGRASHAAILVRSMGIPAVLGIHGLLSQIKNGDFLVVDGNTGIVIVNPPQGIIEDYRKTEKKIHNRLRQLEKLILLPSQTLDGKPMKVMANVGSLVDLEFALHYKAEGVGLFRTELPFMVGDSFPSEEEQFDLYKKVCETTVGKEVVIRTLDFGGDKLLPGWPHEKNPFLGYRSTRIFLNETNLFQCQLRAILRASVFGRLKLLFPFISSMEEIRKVKIILKEVKDDLRKENEPFDGSIPVGVMIEVPSAAIMAERILKEVDFLSIGTNDLVQYTLAVDRENHLVSAFYQDLNPAVIWLVKHVVDAATRAGKPVSLCGEMGGNPLYTPLLMGLGLCEFSVNPVSIPDIKGAVRSISLKDAQAIAETALTLSTAQEIEQLLRSREQKELSD